MIDQGATYSATIRYKNRQGQIVPLTGFQARMQLRLSPDDSPVVSITTGGGDMTIDGDAGEVSIALSPSTTDAIPANVYLFDVEIYTPGDEVVHRIMEGKAYVRAQVTK